MNSDHNINSTTLFLPHHSKRCSSPGKRLRSFLAQVCWWCHNSGSEHKTWENVIFYSNIRKRVCSWVCLFFWKIHFCLLLSPLQSCASCSVCDLSPPYLRRALKVRHQPLSGKTTKITNHCSPSFFHSSFFPTFGINSLTLINPILPSKTDVYHQLLSSPHPNPQSFLPPLIHPKPTSFKFPAFIPESRWNIRLAYHMFTTPSLSLPQISKCLCSLLICPSHSHPTCLILPLLCVVSSHTSLGKVYKKKKWYEMASSSKIIPSLRR